ncbi:MAG TPA: T9SS type A sorting domain-containing protein [Flavobacteriales bacterium]|nr:T9SS type A sorting domain-containing protein [Flavobacteriales bacterium]
MKQHYSFLALAALLSANASAQSINVTDHEGNVVNSTTRYVYCDADASMAELDLPVVNVSGDDKWIGLKRYEVSVQAGTQNYFCWDVCFNAANAGAHPMWQAQDPLYLTHNVPVTNFHAYYKPMGFTAVSTFRYVWYTTSDPNDSTWVDIVFSASPTGIEENAAQATTLTAYPNPSLTGTVTLDYELASAQGARLVVYNTLGERALVRTLANGQGRVTLAAGELGAGVWFANIEQNGRAVATRRLVVVR